MAVIVLFAVIPAALARGTERTGTVTAMGSGLGVDDSTRARAAADNTATGLLAANPDALSVHVGACVRTGLQRWDCPVTLSFSNGDASAVFEVGPELHRARRNGRWVGKWRPTGRLVVVGVREPAALPT